ncbi:MAG: DNA polymerase I [Hamadaea sp.]|uniref:DNA polymerase I n=1 Tax=Hamadaea sp. TaxID=2024425 RepID=UPI0017B323E8|nr:DNA polymerase I [Hamadaea sp.]NUR74359.1 DNA polymerase I [Hamadaea sp.]NUT21544.1 DNA polymerase I [Hamadaea sp.]
MTDARLLLLDGHSLAYRAFFALPAENFSTTTGQTTNAVYGFTSMLINVIKDERPTHIAVAFDVSRRSFRTEQYAEYKAGRSETPEQFKGQVSLVHEVLDALKISHVQLEGYEADDVIATMARQGREAGMKVFICTGDRDAFQLITDDVTVLYPRKGVSDLARMDPAAVRERYGVGPDRYRDLAALVGESSDNLPGVPGVGPKTAAKWIDQYGGIDGVVEHADQIKGKAGDSLREHLAGVIRNHQLNYLLDDLTLPLAVDETGWTGWDREAVHRVFDALEFRVLRERLYQYLEITDEPEAQAGFDVTGEVMRASGALTDWLIAQAGKPTGVAVSGVFGRGTGNLTGVALATDESAAWFDPSEVDAVDDESFARWLGDPDQPKVLHDEKPALLAFAARGWQLAGVTCDTALAAYLARPDQRSYDLADLSVRYLHRELRAEAPDDGGQLALDFGDTSAADSAGEALMLRARATLDLVDALGAELDKGDPEAHGSRLLAEVELPLVKVLARMEQTGIAADTDYLSELEAFFAGEVKSSAQSAYGVIGREFNLGSPKQLQEILFTELNLPKTKKIKTGYTTDADSLQWLYAETGHPVLEHLLRHRDVAKLKSTVDGLLKSVSEDGRIHTTFYQTVAATGRLSSTDPNLQNVPIRTEEGRRIRRAFIVGPDYESLMTADYSQIEMRIMADLSGDEGLITAFTSGEDLHTWVASQVFETDEITADHRRKIKAMSYGLAYGLSAFGLAQQLGISTQEASGLMEDYFARFGGVRDYLRRVVDQARRDGYTETILGRRRYLPDLTSDNRQRREMAERMALNAPIQGSAADIIKIAMLRVDAALRDEQLVSRLLLQVHDELVLEIAPGEREQVEALLRREMGGAHQLSVPLEVSVGVGRDWNAADH